MASAFRRAWALNRSKCFCGRQKHTFLWWSDLLLRIRRRHRMGSRGANLKRHSQKMFEPKKYFATSSDSLPLPASPKKRLKIRVSDFNESFLADAFRIERFFFSRSAFG